MPLAQTLTRSGEAASCLIGAALVFFAGGWLAYAHASARRLLQRKRPAYSRVEFDGAEENLVPDVERDECGEGWVKSRAGLYLRQLFFYVAAMYYLMGAVVAAVRCGQHADDANETVAKAALVAASQLLRCCAWAIAATADGAEYKALQRRRHSPLIFVFVCGAAAAALRDVPWALIIAGDLERLAGRASFWALLAHAPLLLSCAAARKHLMVAANESPSPEELSCGLYEVVSFNWLNDLFVRKRAHGSGDKLGEKDLPPLMRGDRVEHSWPALEEAVFKSAASTYGREAYSETGAPTRARAATSDRARTVALFCHLAWLAPAHFIGSGVCRLFYVASAYAQPLGLYAILRKFGTQDAIGWAACGALFFGPVAQACLDTAQNYLQRRVATRCRGALMMLLYTKGSRLDMSADGVGRVGEVVALMSADIQNVLTAVANFHWTWGPLLQLAVTLAGLFYLVGIAAVGALGVMFVLGTLNGRIFKEMAKHTKAFLKARSSRMELITEALQGSRIIKMLAFEKGIAASIAKRRAVDLAILRRLLKCFTGIFTVINATPPLMGMATFLVLAAALGKPFDAATGFTVLTLLDNLRVVLAQVPSNVNNIATGYFSLQRIEAFLDAPEVDARALKKDDDDGLQKGAIAITKSDFIWGGLKTKSDDGAVESPLLGDDEEKSGEGRKLLTLRGIDLHVAPGQLCVVVGITGGGKSSLLAAILGEIVQVRGSAKVRGSLAYCAQQSWCQNATLRHNITFGRAYEEKKYLDVVEACALTDDLAQFPAGDLTEVGERGISLSGGQQQRIQLARALYQDADVYVLDDPLSAVDVHVGEHLYTRVILERLVRKGKTVVLATHQVSLGLSAADLVVVVAADGTIAAQGEPAALRTTQRGKALFAELEDKAAAAAGGQVVAVAKKQAEAPKHKDESSRLAAGRLVGAEERKAGAPAIKVFGLYLGSAGFWFGLGCLLFVVAPPFKYLQSNALTDWIAGMEKGEAPVGRAMFVYVAWTAFFVLDLFLAMVASNWGVIKASKALHERLSWAVLRSKTSWYDRSPVGRIQNRFSTDIQAVDRQVGNSVTFVIRGAVQPLVSLFAIGAHVPLLLPCFFPVLYISYKVCIAYLRVARDLKRIDSTTKSPVFSCFNESLNGLATLRAFDGAVTCFSAKFSMLVDRTNSAELHLNAVNFWLSIRLNALGAVVQGLTTVVLYSSAALSPPQAGLVLTYAVGFTGAMIMLLRTYTDLELALNAVERILEYLENPSEPPLDLQTDDAKWLVTTPGEVRFENVTMRYSTQASPALKSLSVTFDAGKSFGICGRTGAGKSTLLQCLLRLYPIEAGRVLIDGIDIATVGLRALRGKIAIVPQDPTIFAGTVRYNLDMFDERSDADLVFALEQSRGGATNADANGAANEAVAELALDFVCSEFGGNLSLGERQLLCLARAIARKSRLVLMDEATANVDQTTDARIQDLLRCGPLSTATRITIAHRLGTIVHCDRVLVLAQGGLAEDDSPAKLLADPQSHFYQMCDAGGNLPAFQQALRDADQAR